ncbi:MAG: hypothetical protein ABJ013_14995 [Halioglobus sp.]
MNIKSTLLQLIGAVLLASAGSAYAAMPDAEAQQTVERAVNDGFSADAVVEMLVEDGRTLQEAGEVVVKATTGEPQIDLARAAICAATDKEEAEDVGARVLAEMSSSAATALVQGILETYETTGCINYADRRPPPSYAPSNTGSHGGINPSVPGGSPGRPPGPGSPAN